MEHISEIEKEFYNKWGSAPPFIKNALIDIYLKTKKKIEEYDAKRTTHEYGFPNKRKRSTEEAHKS